MPNYITDVENGLNHGTIHYIQAKQIREESERKYEAFACLELRTNCFKDYEF